MPIRDPEKRKAYYKKWRENNSDKIKDAKKEYYQNHKDERDVKTQNYREKKPWVITYTNGKQRCENPKHPSYKNYGAKGIKFELTLDELESLWMRDKAYNMSKPSLDRKKSDQNYTFDNCRFVELSINVSKKVDSKIVGE